MKLEELAPAGKNTVIVGVGNLNRGDDGIGIYTVKKLIDKGYTKIYNCQTTPENYLAKICSHSPDIVLFVDAVELDEKPGKVKIIEARKVSAGFTTHNAGLDMVAEFIHSDCGAKVYIIAVQPGKLDGKMSEKVQKTGDEIIKELEEKICMNQ
ncbi:MAG: hydrogenase maturation protease [Elusimicrobiota bacterium]